MNLLLPLLFSLFCLQRYYSCFKTHIKCPFSVKVLELCHLFDYLSSSPSLVLLLLFLSLGEGDCLLLQAVFSRLLASCLLAGFDQSEALAVDRRLEGRSWGHFSPFSLPGAAISGSNYIFCQTVAPLRFQILLFSLSCGLAICR